MRRRSRDSIAAAWLLGMIGGLAGCEASVQLVQPRASAAPPTVLTFAASDTALAGRAGWSPGVPGTTVHIRQDQNPTILSYTTDDQGMLTLPDLPIGDYWVWAERYPTGDEGQAPVFAPPALGGGRRIGLQRGSTESIPLRGQEDGSLVISEFHYHQPPAWMTGGVVDHSQYYWYIELYNNSDTTIYLDGKIIGGGFNYPIDGDLWPCSETAEFRNDPLGIWAQFFQAFPGSGHDYPVAPGKTVLIPEEAIDHSAITPGLPDLRNADFQFSFAGHVANPAVPTMLPIQIRTPNYGTLFYSTPAVAFVSLPLDIASLPRKQGRYTGGDLALFPREAILDVAVLYSTYYAGPQTIAPLCRSIVDPSIDPLAAFVRPELIGTMKDSTRLYSAQRRLLPDGLHLQRTGVSAVDWEMRARSPGKVP
jgi:hypothetical protein